MKAVTRNRFNKIVTLCIFSPAQRAQELAPIDVETRRMTIAASLTVSLNDVVEIGSPTEREGLFEMNLAFNMPWILAQKTIKLMDFNKELHRDLSFTLREIMFFGTAWDV